jgi:type I restriction enzyme S subunit
VTDETCPAAWSWTNLATVGEVVTEGTDPRNEPRATHVAPDNIEGSTGRLLPCRNIEEDNVVSTNFRFREGDVLYTKLRPYLNKVVVAPFAGLCSSDILPIRPRIEAKFLAYWMLSPEFVRQAIPRQTGVTLPRISRKSLNETRLPLAPLPEQRRIVEAIETRFTRLDKTIEILKTIVGNGIPSDGGRIGQLRRSILRAAFEGRLVPQDPSDEPAIVLLERIRHGETARPIPAAKRRRSGAPA